MTKKNETKNTKAAAEQPEDTKPVATVETPNTTAPAGADVEGPDDAPKDGPGCEAVTVISLNYTGHGHITAESVKCSLKGVDCEIRIVEGDSMKTTVIETLLATLPEVRTERVILMTDQQLLLTPVSIYDIGVRKSRKFADGVAPDTRMPVLMHKSALLPLLEALAAEKPHADVAVEYLEATDSSVVPIMIGDWREDPWLLPIVSENPDRAALEKWALKKKFGWVKQWTPAIEKIFAGE